MLNSDVGRAGRVASSWKQALWIGLLLAGSIGFSFVFACATPFAALAALAALNMPQRDVYSVVGGAWVANQAIGYGFLHYPQTWDSFAWGGAIGIACAVGAVASVIVAPRIARWGKVTSVAAAFLAAFAAYQAGLFVASLGLPGGGFSLSVLSQVLVTNVGALIGLVVAHQIAVAVGLVARAVPSAQRPVVA